MSDCAFLNNSGNFTAFTYNTATQRNQQTFSVHFILNQSFI